jgi:uncharacterized protein (TIGR02588 family)
MTPCRGRHRTPGPLQTPFAESVTDYGEQVVVSAEITVQYLPLQGTQDGTFVTTRDPASHALRSRVESLQCP